MELLYAILSAVGFIAAVLIWSWIVMSVWYGGPECRSGGTPP